MKLKSIFTGVMLAAFSLTFTACGTSDSDSSYNESSYSSEDSGSNAIHFSNSNDVRSYLNGKTFSGDGLRIRFYNNGQSVDVNGSNIANNIRISDIGINNNGVAYATVQVVNPAGVTTTFTLLAVEGRAQLIDPNDGTVYEY